MDIRDVTIDPALTKHERMVSYLRQVGDYKNLHLGDRTIHVAYTETGPTLLEILKGLTS